MRIKVFYIIDSLGGGGAERIAADLAKNIDRDRFTPVMCTTRKPGPYADELKSLGISANSLHRKGRYDLGGFFRLLKLLREEKPHVVHTHKVGSNTLGRLAAILTGVPVIVAHEHSRPERSFGQRVVDKVLSSATSYVITCDEAMRKALLKSERLKSDKVVVIHNGIEVGKYDISYERLATALNGLGLSPGPIVGCFARLEPQKDIGNLLRAVPYVLQKVPDTNFLIAGKGPQREEMERLAIEIGVAENVRFLGFRKDIPELLSGIDLLVLPSEWEGLPLVLLEAMAARKPIVSTNVGGISELVEDGVNGLLVPPRSPQELASAISDLLLNRESAERMGIAGREKVEKEFSMERMTRNIEELYVKAVNEKGIRL